MKLLTLAPFMVLLSILVGTSQDIYVSPTGSDYWNNGTKSSPWGTFQHAVNNVTPGYTVYAFAGTYIEKFAINSSGQSGAPITIKNLDGGNVVIEGDGAFNLEQTPIIAILDQSHIRIEGISLGNNNMPDAVGLKINGNCQDIQIKDMDIFGINFNADPDAEVTVFDHAQPLIVEGSDANNPVTKLVLENVTVRSSRTGRSQGLTITGNVTNFLIKNCQVYSITNVGIDILGHESVSSANDQPRNGVISGNTVNGCKSPYHSAAGIFIDGAKNITVENNIVFNNQWGIEIGCTNTGKSASGILVRSNLIYQNVQSGLAIGGSDFPDRSGKIQGCKIYNNTMYRNDKAREGYGEILLNYIETSDVFNNILFASNMNVLVESGGVESNSLSMDYNLYFSPDPELAYFHTYTGSYDGFDEYQGGGNELESHFADPEFISTSNSLAFRLKNNSPAIDAGDPGFSYGSGELDIDGEDRIIYNNIDIGADEMSATLPIQWVEDLSAKAVNQYVELHWAALENEFCNRYIIQRLENENWENILSASCSGDAKIVDYLLEDKQPLIGDNCYRIQQTDLDGQVQYSQVVCVSFAGSNQAFFPNPLPSSSDLIIDHGIQEIWIHSLEGVQIYRGHSNLLDRDQLPSGVYSFQGIYADGRVIRELLIVE